MLYSIYCIYSEYTVQEGGSLFSILFIGSSIIYSKYMSYNEYI